MEKTSFILFGSFLALFPQLTVAQNPEYVDPGNVRGDEDTLYLWEDPTYYVPFLIVVVLIIAFFLFRKKRKQNT